MSKLRVTFGDLHVGWVRLAIHKADEVVSFQAAYIYPSFHLLVDALLNLRLNEGEVVVTWQCEPTEYELRFLRKAEMVSLDILHFPDSRRTVFYRNVVLSATGTYEEICLPFWRALRSLQGRYSEEEIEQRWQCKFPTEEMKILTSALGK